MTVPPEFRNEAPYRKPAGRRKVIKFSNREESRRRQADREKLDAERREQVEKMLERWKIKD